MIIVDWKDFPSKEYVDIDPTNPDAADITSTVEVWGAGRTVQYVVRMFLEGNLLRLEYHKEDNLELANDAEIYWGVSEIHLENPAGGLVTWQHHGSNRRRAATWKKRIRNFEIYRRMIRDWRFRRNVLREDNMTCVLTGETSVAVLDAAHIDAVKEDGLDSVNNLSLIHI